MSPPAAQMSWMWRELGLAAVPGMGGGNELLMKLARCYGLEFGEATAEKPLDTDFVWTVES